MLTEESLKSVFPIIFSEDSLTSAFDELKFENFKIVHHHSGDFAILVNSADTVNEIQKIFPDAEVFQSEILKIPKARRRDALFVELFSSSIKVYYPHVIIHNDRSVGNDIDIEAYQDESLDDLHLRVFARDQNSFSGVKDAFFKWQEEYCCDTFGPYFYDIKWICSEYLSSRDQEGEIRFIKYEKVENKKFFLWLKVIDVCKGKAIKKMIEHISRFQEEECVPMRSYPEVVSPEVVSPEVVSGKFNLVYIDHSNIAIGAQNGQGNRNTRLNIRVFKSLLIQKYDPLKFTVRGTCSFERARVQMEEAYGNTDIMDVDFRFIMKGQREDDHEDVKLQIKMLREILKYKKDAPRTTIVLATGDGKCKNDSDFPHAVNHALEEGYKVHLWTWRASTSDVYNQIAENIQKFQIFYLDDFCDKYPDLRVKDL